MSATVRFAKVVDTAGKPQLHTLWAGAEHDPEFQRAVKARRVMTVHQENVGTKADFGEVGFTSDGPAQFLVFPRTLRAFEGQKIVGIKYDLVAEPPPARPPRAKKSDKPDPAPARKKTEPPPRIQQSPTEPPPKPKTVEAPPAPPEPAPRAHAAAREILPKPQPDKAPNKKPEEEFNRRATLNEVRRAMRELEAGKTVVAFRRLEKLASQLAAEM